MRLTLGMAALAATFAAASPASAQVISSTAEAEARGVVLTAQSLTNEADLDFGTITVNPDPLTSVGGPGGTVTIAASAAGTRTVSDSDITELPGATSAAIFHGFGAPNQSVELTLNQPAGGVLVNANGEQIEAVLSLDDAGPITTNATGEFFSYVGGVFTIDADQQAGLYTADFDLTADFQ